MNTIPLTFDGWEIPYSVIQGSVCGEAESGNTENALSVVLLNRGGKYYRTSVFRDLEDSGFSSVLSVENTPEPYDVENLSPRFPAVKFLIPQRKLTVGEMINAGIAESTSRFVLVMWNDQRLSPQGLPESVLSQLASENLFCCAPFLSGDTFGSLPVQMIPQADKKKFNIQPFPCVRDNERTVYPFDFTGIYDRAKFVEYGGFDSSIRNPYWQNADFGFRVNLWGEEIRIFSHFKMVYESEVPTEDVAADISYLQFYLKNLAPVRKGAFAVLPFRRFFPFMGKSGLNVFDSWRMFRSASKWVAVNAPRFVTDAASLAASWEPSVL